MTSPEEQEALDRLVAGTAKPVMVKNPPSKDNPFGSTSVSAYNAEKDQWQTVVDSSGVYPTAARAGCWCGDPMCIQHSGAAINTIPMWSTPAPPPNIDPLASERETWIRVAEGLKKERDELAKALEIASLPKPIEQRAGHVPTRWLAEAYEMAKECDAFITIQLEEEGVAVIGRSGEEYGTIALAWEVLEKSPHNPLLKAIEGVERHLSALERLKEIVASKDNKEQTIAA